MNPLEGIVEFRSGATRVEILEEIVHVLQQGKSVGVRQVEQDLLTNWPVGRMGLDPCEIRAVATEVHAKSFLLRNADLLELGKADRYLLRKQIDRLRAQGRGGGY